MSTTTADPDLLNHFTVAIYPFLHDLTASNRAARLDAVEGHWAPWWDRLTEPDRVAALEATTFFLPYVRSLLYPEVAVLAEEPPGPQFSTWTQQLADWNSGGLSAYVRHLPPSAILRPDPARVGPSTVGPRQLRLPSRRRRYKRRDAPGSPGLG